jgi:hypothetical protein
MDQKLIQSILYVVGATACSVWIVYRNPARHRFIAFAFCVWILAVGVLSTDVFTIPLPKSFGFQLQFNRVLLILFGIYVVASLFHLRRKSETIGLHAYEYYLISFFCAFLIVLAIHVLLGNIDTKDLLVTYLGWLTFLVFYGTAKKITDVRFARAVFAALIIAGIVNSIVGIMQFFVDENFLRVGAERVAFAGRLRSSGILDAEYTYSYFILTSVVTSLIFLRNRLLKTSIVALGLTGIFLSFHRMSWSITMIVLAWYWFVTSTLRSRLIVFLLSLAVSLVLLLGEIPLFSVSTSSELASERLFQDTITGRVNLLEVAMERISQFWLYGVGSKTSDIYFFDVISSGEKYAATGQVGGIHNLYVNIAYFYGIPVVGLLVLFLISAMGYFARAMRIGGMALFVPGALLVFFSLGNMTNFFFLSSHLALLLGLLLGVGRGLFKEELELQNLLAS